MTNSPTSFYSPRFLSPSDTEQVKILCRSWFPIEYPDTWYQEITANPRSSFHQYQYWEIVDNDVFGFRFFSLAATLQGRIVGIIVAETKELGQVTRRHICTPKKCRRFFCQKIQLIPSSQLAKEDRTILASCFRRGTKVFSLSSFQYIFDTFLQVAYILSLGVCEEFRKQGIASLLLENLISHLTSEAFEVGLQKLN